MSTGIQAAELSAPTLKVNRRARRRARRANKKASRELDLLFEHVIFDVSSADFWKRFTTYTFLMSVVGHLIENVYTGIGFFAGSFSVDDPNYPDIWLRPLKPMWVYSVCTIFFFLLIIPLKEQIYKRLKSKDLRSKVLTVAAVFGAGFLIALLTELVMGLLWNQPNELGAYPLWDFTNYNLTVLNQAYLVNDFFYAVLITVCAFFIFPLLEQSMVKLKSRTQTIVMACSIIAVGALFVGYLPTYIDPLLGLEPTGHLTARA